jgi:electron transport complex protein RnfA
MSYIIMIIAAIFVNNIVLAQFLGICPFLGVSKKVDTAAGMGMAVAFVMLLATLVTWPIYYYCLVPYNLQFMQTIVYILVIAALVQMVEIILKKSMPSLYAALGVFLPLITTNCTILGVAINVINFEYTLLESAVYAVATALGFALAMVLFAGIREQIAVTDVPKGMKGTPIALLIAGLLAMAFMGFSGIDNTLKVMFNIG